MPAVAGQPAAQRLRLEEQNKDTCAFPIQVLGMVPMANSTSGSAVLRAVAQQAGKCLRTKELIVIRMADGTVMDSIPDTATAQRLKEDVLIAELGGSFDIMDSVEARLMEALAGYKAEQDAQRVTDLAVAASQRAADLADVAVLAEDRMCRVAGLVMARLRRAEGKGGGQRQAGPVCAAGRAQPPEPLAVRGWHGGHRPASSGAF